MILSRNWNCFKGFSLKLGFGFGIGLGSAYFLNNINCDAPAKILQQDTGIEFDEKIVLVSNSKNKNSSDIIYNILDVCSLYSLKVEIILYKKYDFKSEMMYSIYNP